MFKKWWRLLMHTENRKYDLTIGVRYDFAFDFFACAGL